jgi:hypothetical protein
MDGMTATQNRNAYLDQVVAQGAQLEQDLRSKRSVPMAAGPMAGAAAPPPPPGAAPAPARLRADAAGPAPLPEIVARMPKPAELRAVTIGGNDGTTLAGLVAELGAVLAALRSALPPADSHRG